MQEPSQDITGQEEDMHKLSIQFKCYRCGKQGHSATECKFKKAKCYLCQKVGHLSRVCQTTFKVSVNPVIRSQIYLLPIPEEIFSMLANGESYTKQDLARAY